MVDYTGGEAGRPGRPEPIAIIGMSCRFPGNVNSADDFWSFLRAGEDAISEVPTGRWDPYAEAAPENEAALRSTTRFGGFLSDIQGFDADFFGISPREAGLMDPQQRMVLEVSWQALEHAGVPPHQLSGSDTGVFIGVGSDDYGRRLLEDLPRIEAWTGIGGAMCAVANRVSYTLDLRGASMAVDTACSSSLVALHLACQSLRAGESPLALAGGVMVMAGPGLTMVLDAAGATSADGRSKSFDAAADGYGRGEGAGVVALKRLSDAQADGDRVLAVLRGSAVHQDGKTNGIMAPSSQAQEHLLRQTYRNAGVAPESVDYIEAHGTGTRAGDPIEATAMAAVFGASRPAEQPCLIGSVKPSIGHLEAGAGIAGVIKTVLALQHGEIPPTANFETPNPSIPWESAGLKVVAQPTPWQPAGQPRLAGVSGYGYGGTIAHVILEEAPPDPLETTTAVEVDRGASAAAYPLSGATQSALREYAARLADYVEEENPALPSVGHTLAVRRSPLTHRATAVAADHTELAERLRALAAGAPTAGVATGTVLAPPTSGTVWVFSGHGSQWIGMGRELLAEEPVFAAVLDDIGPIFEAELGFTPRHALSEGDFHTVDQIQPMIFATQVALAAVWRDRGLYPAAVIGHSVGEIAAAVTAGVLSVHDGAHLVCRRSRLLRHASGKGAMAMVSLPFDQVRSRLCHERGAQDVVAAIAASPSSTVIAGDHSAVEDVAKEWEDGGMAVRRVDSDVAFHSRHMDPLLDELVNAVAGMVVGAPEVPLYTTALDDPRATVARDGSYWAQNLRNPVRFAEAVTAAVEDGYRLFLEISAHPVVAHSINETLAELEVDDACVAHTLRRNRPEWESLLTNLGLLYAHGASVDWTRLWPAAPLAELPHNAWQHSPYWAESGPRHNIGGQRHDVDSHTLLGGRTKVNASPPITLWHTYLDESCRPYPGDHPVRGVEIIPAAVLLNTFFAAASADTQRPDLTDVSLKVPVSVSAPRQLQVVTQERTIRLSSRLLDGDVEEPLEREQAWLTHTTASVDAPAPAPPHALAIAELRQYCSERLAEDFVTDRLAGIGVAAMGFPWQIEELAQGDEQLLATVKAGDASDEKPMSWAAIMDAALSIASVVFPGPPTLRMPAHIDRVSLRSDSSPIRAFIHVRVAEGGAAADTVNVDIAAEDGRVVARMMGLRYGVLDGDPGAATSPRRIVHEMAWRPLATAPDADSVELRDVVIVGDDHEAVRMLSDRYRAMGVPCAAVTDPEELTALRDRIGAASAVLVAPASLRAGESGPEASIRSAWLLARTAQWLLGVTGAAADEQPKLWCLTQGVRQCHDEAALGHASLWGIGRVIGGEHPELWGGVLDLAESPDKLAVQLLDVLRAAPGEDVVALDEEGAHVGRLAQVASEPTRPPQRFRPEGTYLITGGLGMLGLEVAHWLAGRGAHRLVLAGRAALPPRAQWDSVCDSETRRRIEGVRSLEALGVTVRTVALDITDREQAQRLLSPAELGLPPIRGIVHAAGVLDNRMLRDLDKESMRTVVAPKAAGAWVLHELFPPNSVDFFILFSSCGLLLGLPGQSSYASGNAFLDALAAHRRANGGDDTVSFGWTSWRGLGMSTSSAVIDTELAARGTADISATEAFQSWEYAERHSSGYFAFLRTIPLEPAMTRPSLLSELAAEEDTDIPAAAGDAQWEGMSREELYEAVGAEVDAVVAGEIKLPAADLDSRRPLTELGLDSVMSVVIRRNLERRFGVRLAATLLWDRPNTAAISLLLTDLVWDRLHPGGAESASDSDEEYAPAADGVLVG
ncbi:type I polyketide synthase [Salinactinospora qingdaonensis]|uniref:Phthiocerol type I polyketide synthase PpsA n=1 Tax=Salinactinospora qingdaonensis TaxID=702744 RepID=A0ABP7FYL5_9ACTN